MREVVCEHCNQIVPMPDDLATAHCMRCGGVIARGDTNITDAPAPIAHARPADRQRSTYDKPSEQQHAYSSWDDFRANSPALQRALTELATRPLPSLKHTELWDLPKGTADLVATLGEPMATIHKPSETIIQRLIGAGLVLGSCSIIALVLRAKGLQTDVVLLSLLLAPLLILGVYVLITTPPSAITVWVFENGILSKRGAQLASRLWNDVEDFQVSMEQGHPVFWLTVAPGLRTSFSRVQSATAVQVMEFIELKLAAAKLLPALQTVLCREQARFGEISFDLGGITGRRFFAAWQTVRRVTDDQKVINVTQVDGAVTQIARYRNVSFPMTMFAVAQIMIEESANIDPIAT